MSIDVISSRYAKALYQSAVSQKKLDEVMAALKMLRELAWKLPQLKEFFENPLLTHGEQKKIIHGLFDGKIPPQVMVFMDYIASKRRLNYLMHMVDAFEAMYREAHNEIVMQVQSAYALDDAFKKQLTDKITALTGKQIIGEYSLDKSMIGGIRVWAAGKLYEYSFNREFQDYKRKALQTV